jgi:hypothetical protein
LKRARRENREKVTVWNLNFLFGFLEMLSGNRSCISTHVLRCWMFFDGVCKNTYSSFFEKNNLKKKQGYNLEEKKD